VLGLVGVVRGPGRLAATIALVISSILGLLIFGIPILKTCVD
jgi:hypothetical protein